MRSKLLANTSIKSNFLIVISHSARALSESACRAGWNVISVDGFADTDTLESSRQCWCLPLENGEFVASYIDTCLIKLQQHYPQANVILGAGAENLAHQIDAFPGWVLYANSEDIVTQLTQPREFFNALGELQIDYPAIQYGANPGAGKWLYKMTDSCGGMGVSHEYIENTHGYWQQEISGLAISVLCISDGYNVACLGFNQQYSMSSFSAYPYVYQGVLINVEVSHDFKIKTISYIDKIIKYFNIKGVFSLDMILNNEASELGLYVLEINPRISASFELYERVNPGLNLVDAHIRVCEGERLPEFNLSNAKSAYLVVYAEDDYLISENLEWPDWVTDKPEALRQILKYEPICSVHADEHESKDSLYSLLQRRADQVISLIN